MRVLDEISLEVEDRTFLAILGSSGCGKSTLLRITAGLEASTEGRIFFNGEEITKPSAQWGMVYEPFAALDAQTKMEMQKELLRIWSIEKQMVLFVTHDVDEAVFLADVVCVLSSSPGRVKEVVVNEVPRHEDGSRNRKGKAFDELEDRLFALIDKGW